MTSTEQLIQFEDDIVWFAHVQELRVHLITAEESFAKVLRALMADAHRYSPHAAPYLRIVTPSNRLFAAGGPAKGGDEWGVRAQAVVEAWQSLAESFRAVGLQVNLPPTLPYQDNLGGFAWALHQWDQALASLGLGKIVVDLDPLAVEDKQKYWEEVAQLLAISELENVRFVLWAAPQHSPLEQLHLPKEHVFQSTLVEDHEEAAAQLDALVAQIDGGGPGADLGRLGQVWPDVEPPPRRKHDGSVKKQYGSLTEEMQLQQEAYREMMRGAQHFTKGEPIPGVAKLRAARDLYRQAAMPEEALAIDLAAATSCVSAGDTELALTELSRVAEEAKLRGRWDFYCQAMSAKAALLAANQKLKPAIDAYSEAIGAAREAGEEWNLFRVELLRACGQLCLEQKQELEAIRCFNEAIQLAHVSPPEQQISGAGAARQLAQICRERGQSAQAEALEQQAESFETGLQRSAREAEEQELGEVS